MAESQINRGETSARPRVTYDPRGELSNDEALTMSRDAFLAARDWRAPKEDDWTLWYRLWRSQAEVKDWPFDTSLFIPLTWATVQTFLPRMVAQRPQITVEARGDEKFENARFHRELMQYQWTQIGMPMTLINWILSSLVLGTGITKDGWALETGPQMFRGPDGKPSLIKDALIKNEPFVNTVDLEAFYPAPFSMDIPSAPFVCEHFRMQWWELDQMAKAGIYNQQAVNELKEKGKADQSNEEYLKVRKARLTDFGFGDPKAHEDKAGLHYFDIIEYWDDFNQYVICLNPAKLLLRQKNPFWHKKKPYNRIVDNPDFSGFYGMGEPEILEAINMELNEMHNLRLEASKRSVLQQFKVVMGSPAWWHDIRFTPQGKIPVRTQDDIQPLFSPSPNIAHYREEDSLRIWHQFVSGASDQLVGLASELDSETATGASLLAQASASRVGLKFLIMSEMGLRPLGQKWIALNEQNVDEAIAFSVVGPNGQRSQRISPQDLATYGTLMDVKIDVAATDPLNREVELQKNVNLLAVLLPVYGASHPIPNQILKRIAELSDLDFPEDALQTPALLQEGAAGQSPASGSDPLQGRISQIAGAT